MIRIDRLDHLVLTVADIAATCDFYSRILGMSVETFAEGFQSDRLMPMRPARPALESI